MYMSKRLLLVEDNQDMRDSLRTFLTEDGWNVMAVASAEDGIDAVDERQFHAALIDINLPGKSGFSVIEYIRSNGNTYPLIAMTARDGIIDKIKGFDLGLTDYIVKPFDLLELRARLQAHVRTQNSPTISTDNFALHTDRLECYAFGQKLDVTMLEFRIIELLLRNNHTLVTTDDIIEHAWGEQAELSTPPIRIHIANIRRKIGDTTLTTIRTIPGVGYIFNDPVME
jgi:two-component system, OmpR family, response regulator QseB